MNENFSLGRNQTSQAHLAKLTAIENFVTVSPERSLPLIVQVPGEAPFPKASLEPSWVGELTRGYYDIESSDVTLATVVVLLDVATILFVVIATQLSFMEGVMPMTHVNFKVELFGSHCVVGVCGIAGFMEAVTLLCLNASGLCAFLLRVGTVRPVAPVLLFWVVQPCASQTSRCILIT